jgi:hypothetical protein
LDVWDTTGREANKALYMEALVNCQVVLLTISVADPEAFEELPTVKKDIKKKTYSTQIKT